MPLPLTGWRAFESSPRCLCPFPLLAGGIAPRRHGAFRLCSGRHMPQLFLDIRPCPGRFWEGFRTVRPSQHHGYHRGRASRQHHRVLDHSKAAFEWGSPAFEWNSRRFLARVRNAWGSQSALLRSGHTCRVVSVPAMSFLRPHSHHSCFGLGVWPRWC